MVCTASILEYLNTRIPRRVIKKGRYTNYFNQRCLSGVSILRTLCWGVLRVLALLLLLRLFGCVSIVGMRCKNLLPMSLQAVCTGDAIRWLSDLRGCGCCWGPLVLIAPRDSHSDESWIYILEYRISADHQGDGVRIWWSGQWHRPRAEVGDGCQRYV